MGLEDILVDPADIPGVPKDNLEEVGTLQRLGDTFLEEEDRAQAQSENLEIKFMCCTGRLRKGFTDLKFMD